MSTLWEAVKDPNEVKDYAIDWAPELANGEVIATQAWTLISGADNALVIVDGEQHDNSKSFVWLSGGTSGVDYELLCHMTTSSTPYPRELETTGRIKCRSK